MFEYAMQRGTFMVLKRLIVTALGALGLGALVSGPSSAKEIPAPDLFDGQVACSMNVPTPPMTLVGRDAMTMMTIGITAKIETNMAILVNEDVTAGNADDLIPHGADAGLADILWVIPAGNSNCGAGTYTAEEATAFNTANSLTVGTDDAAVEEGDPKPIAAGVAADVGAGYTDTLAVFMKVVEADDDVEAKQMALDTLLKNTARTPAQETAAREALAESQGEQAKAHAALYAATGPDRDGSIYRAGVAEWRAKGAVEKAITAWNTAVGEFDTAQTTLTDGTQTFANYVPLGFSTSTAGQILSLISDTTDAMSDVNLANVRTYANAVGANTGVQDSMTGAVTVSNFDAAGNLLIPKSDADSDASTPLTETTVASTYATANTQLTGINNVVTALETLQSENTNALLQETIDEAVRRAKLEQAHYQAQFDKLVADNTDFDTDGDGDATTMPDSFKIRYDALTKARTKRDNAGVTLETAVQTREAATAAVRAAFTNPQSFYQQLVDRRQYVKNNADMEVTRLAGLTGDDAPTAKQTEDAAKAAADAQTALAEAQETLESFQGLIADDSPVKDLILETLKPDSGMGAGDDGQELVDAIIGVNQTAADAKRTADEVAESVSGLTGEEGDVSMNTARSMQNAEDIGELDTRVTKNEDEIWDDDGNSRIDANETRSMTNAENIATNATNIAANATNIMTNTTEIGYGEDGMSRIDHNEARSMTNADDIMTNAGHIATNSTMIGENTAAIGMNTSAISALDGRVGSNASAINRNEMRIGELNEALEVVRAGVAASMALAGMPAINGRGISIGVGSYDGESAFAVGFQIQGEMASFKVGVTSSGGETGASAGVGFQF